MLRKREHLGFFPSIFPSQCSVLKTLVMNALHLKATALGQLVLVSGLFYDPEG